jgi:hypothetical protein
MRIGAIDALLLACQQPDQHWAMPEHAGTLLHVTIAALHDKGNHALDELRLLLRLAAGGWRLGCHQTLLGVFETHERGRLEQPAPETRAASVENSPPG